MLEKLRILSDLHVEFYASPKYLQAKLNKLYPTVDEDEILIIAGDLGVAGTGKKGEMLNPEYQSMLEYFAKKWNTVILVPGNHEYYDRSRIVLLEDVDAMIEKECKKLGITFLNKNYIMIKGLEDLGKSPKNSESYMILGCTLWSEATKEAYKGMNDKLKAILNHDELLKVHFDHYEWLKTHLQKCKEKGLKAIVITHHLPLMELTHPKYLHPKYKPLNSAYASKLNDLFEYYSNEIQSNFSKPCLDQSNTIQSNTIQSNTIRLWVCGHTHEKTEKQLYGVDFLINPMGYPREKKETIMKLDVINL
jgi:UDP-2,3-diacylglucosamine pyrophosphatase LpxH